MFDSYSSKSYHTSNAKVSINAVSGGIYKTYKESWFIRFNLKSKLMEYLSNHEKCRYHARLNEYGCRDYDISDGYSYKNYYEEAKPIVVLQMVICGEMEVIAEIMYKEDFENYFKGGNE